MLILIITQLTKCGFLRNGSRFFLNWSFLTNWPSLTHTHTRDKFNLLRVTSVSAMGLLLDLSTYKLRPWLLCKIHSPHHLHTTKKGHTRLSSRNVRQWVTLTWQHITWQQIRWQQERERGPSYNNDGRVTTESLLHWPMEKVNKQRTSLTGTSDRKVQKKVPKGSF